jgi:hypothetical protein
MLGPAQGCATSLRHDRGDLVWTLEGVMTDVKLDADRFEKALRESKARFDAEEVKAQSWIARHPGWTLAIGVVLLLGDLYFAIKAVR